MYIHWGGGDLIWQIYVDGLKEQMQRAHDVARKYLGRNAVRMRVL